MKKNYDGYHFSPKSKDGYAPFSLLKALDKKTTNQRKWILGNVIAELVEYAKEQQKAIVIEDLDFKIKKSKLMYGNKRRNNELSQFAYKQISELLIRKSYFQNIYVAKVNPAYTSYIGKLKYKESKGIIYNIFDLLEVKL